MTHGAGDGGSVLAVGAAWAGDGSVGGFVGGWPGDSVGLGTWVAVGVATLAVGVATLAVGVATLAADRVTGARPADPQATETMSPAAVSATIKRKFTMP